MLQNSKGARDYRIAAFSVFLFGQQTFTIKGTVKDHADPLPGASILIEGTTTGTISDMTGTMNWLSPPIIVP